MQWSSFQCFRFRKFWLGGTTALCLVLLIGCSPGATGRNKGVLVGPNAIDAQKLIEKLDGLSLEAVTVDQFLVGAIDYDVLLVPRADQLPVHVFDPLQHWLSGGGDTVFMGGVPFSRALFQVGGEWLPREQARQRLIDVPFKPLGDDSVLSQYRNIAFSGESKSQIVVNPGSDGDGALMVIQATDWYDYFVRDLPEMQGATLLSFMVRGFSPSKEIYVELVEKDGSKWFRKVPIAPEWERVVSLPGDFSYLEGGEGRSNTNADFGNLTSIGFGQHFKNAGLVNGKYHIWVDELAYSDHWSQKDLPKGDLGEIPRLPGMYPYGDYDVFQMEGVRKATSFEASPFDTEVTVEVEYNGYSASGYPNQGEGFFIPLLSARGEYGETLGFAGGVIAHEQGPFAGSSWAFFNMPDTQPYLEPSMIELTEAIVESFSNGSIFEMQPPEPRFPEQPAASEALTYIRATEDGLRLEDVDGDDFFMIGINYIYPMNRGAFDFWKKETFSPEDLNQIENDFRKMRAAGINAVRIFSSDAMIDDPEVNHAIKELAHRYGIRILMKIVGHSYDEHEREVLARAQRVVESFRDDPAVFGFDLQNEPQIGEIGGIRFDDQPSPLLELEPAHLYGDKIDQAFLSQTVKKHHKGIRGYPKIAPWIEDKEEAKHLYGSHLLWRQAIDGVFSPQHPTILHNYPASVEAFPEALAPFVEALNATFSMWYQPQADLIRSLAPEQLITIGYNKGYVALPFNRDLDFLSHHSYFSPQSAEGVMLYTRVQDVLRAIWPNKPVSIGEFGYSLGTRMGGEFLSQDASAVAEMVMYLYSYASGYSGVMKWRLNDDAVWETFEPGHWLEKSAEASRIRQARFGLYANDGYQSVPKPIAHGLAFLRDYLDHYSVSRGKLEAYQDEDVPQIRTGFTYRSSNALFIAGVDVDEAPMRFTTTDGQPAIVMAMWDDSKLELMSTKTLVLQLDLKSLMQREIHKTRGIQGNYGLAEIDNGTAEIALIKGEKVRLVLGGPESVQ